MHGRDRGQRALGSGGTEHELVHPLLEEDFPDVPAWFNEGFASLLEQSAYDEDDSMRGLVNWRLPGLQRMLKKTKRPVLKRVMRSTSKEFYGDPAGYGVARYLCLYLQEKGKLKKFYPAFRDGFDKDPSGITQMEKVLGMSLKKIEPRWRAWVKRLRWEN